MFYFFCLASSYYLFPDFDTTLKDNTVKTTDQLNNLTSKTDTVFCYYGEGADVTLLQNFVNFKDVFPDFDFYLVNSDFIDELYKNKKSPSPILPALLFFQKGKLITHVSKISSPNQLLFLVDMFGYHRSDVINSSSLEHSIQAIGQTLYTIVTTPGNFESAFDMAITISPSVGTVSIVQMPKEILAKNPLFTDEQANLFRSVDGTIEGFDLKSTKDFLRASVSSFKLSTVRDLKEEKNIVFGFYAPVIHPFIREILSQIGSQLKQLKISTYFIADKSSAKEIKDMTNGIDLIKYGFGYVIVNPKENSFYDTMQFQSNELRANPSDGQAWANSISKALGSFLKHSLKKQYRSQDNVTIEANSSQAVFRVVEKNFKEFTQFPNYNSVLLYMKKSNAESVKMFNQFYEAAKLIKDEKKCAYIFGCFDIERNGNPNGLPDESEIPYVEIWPRNNKHKSFRSFLPHPTIEQLIWTIKAFSSDVFPIITDNLQQKDIDDVADLLKHNMKNWNYKKKEQADEYIKRMNYVYQHQSDFYVYEEEKTTEFKEEETNELKKEEL